MRRREAYSKSFENEVAVVKLLQIPDSARKYVVQLIASELLDGAGFGLIVMEAGSLTCLTTFGMAASTAGVSRTSTSKRVE